MADSDARTEEEAIRDYFKKGFTYHEILALLDKYNGIRMSMATLKRHFKEYGLKRRKVRYDGNSVREKIRSLLDGPDCMGGYRHIWHTLKLQGVRVPRSVVESLLRELDPEGTEERRARRLRRRTYRNNGPNDTWHCDGYDKLKPFGFPIHACVDGWSRKVLWLYVTRSNNWPHNIAAYYLEACEQQGGCPQKLITDSGTENGLMASIHSFFRDDVSSYRYVPSPRNQRIEAWWSYFRRSRTNWWINFFKDLEDQGTFNPASQLQSECLWFCFAPLLQQDINFLKDHWNTHYIRKSRHETIPGRPDSLYYLPENHGGAPSLIAHVPDNEMQYATVHLVERVERNEYHEYFEYVLSTCDLQRPRNWRQGLELYNTLLDCASNGT